MKTKKTTVSTVKKTTTNTKKKRLRPIAHAVGRRKKAVARVWLRPGKGIVTVNGRTFNEYFDTEYTRMQASMPFKIVPVASNYDVDVNVCGGGKSSHAKALKLGFTRALVETDEKIRAMVKKYKLLTVDSRVKERKKYGQRGARAKFQFTKR